MRLTFDYELPETAADAETLKVVEHGVLDLVEDDELGTIDFCIGDTSRLRGRIIPVEGFFYRIAKVEYAVDGKTPSNDKKVSEDSVGRLWLENFEEGEELEVSEGIPAWAYFVLTLLVLAIAYYAFPQWFYPH